eukprot:2698465-Pyramimonas_sp.AAC.1
MMASPPRLCTVFGKDGGGRHVSRCVLSGARAHLLAHFARTPDVAHLVRVDHAAHMAHVEH